MRVLGYRQVRFAVAVEVCNHDSGQRRNRRNRRSLNKGAVTSTKKDRYLAEVTRRDQVDVSVAVEVGKGNVVGIAAGGVRDLRRKQDSRR